MKTSYTVRKTGIATAVAAAVLFAGPVAVTYLDSGDVLGTGAAFAAQTGHDGSVDKGKGGYGGGGRGGGGTTQAAPTTSSSKLGRLNLARAFMSPGFDVTKIDDPLAPLAQIALYKDIMTEPGNVTAEDIETAGTALGTVATVNPVTLSTVEKVNDLLQINTSWTEADLLAVAEKATEVLLAGRDDETETH